jgi:hypothetical protein
MRRNRKREGWREKERERERERELFSWMISKDRR